MKDVDTSSWPAVIREALDWYRRLLESWGRRSGQVEPAGHGEGELTDRGEDQNKSEAEPLEAAQEDRSTSTEDPTPYEVAMKAIGVLDSRFIGGDRTIVKALLNLGPVVIDGFYGDNEGLADIPTTCSVVMVPPSTFEDGEHIFPLWGGIVEVPVNTFGGGIRYESPDIVREFQAHLVYYDGVKRKQLAICTTFGVGSDGKMSPSLVPEVRTSRINKTSVSRGAKYNRKSEVRVRTGKWVPHLRGEFAGMWSSIVMMVASTNRVKEMYGADGACDISMASGKYTVRFIDDRKSLGKYYPPKSRRSLTGKKKILHWVDDFVSGGKKVRGHYRGDDKFEHGGLLVRIRPMNWGVNPFGYMDIKPVSKIGVGGGYGERKRLVSVSNAVKRIRESEISRERMSRKDLDKLGNTAA